MVRIVVAEGQYLEDNTSTYIGTSTLAKFNPEIGRQMLGGISGQSRHAQPWNVGDLPRAQVEDVGAC